MDIQHYAPKRPTGERFRTIIAVCLPGSICSYGAKLRQKTKLDVQGAPVSRLNFGRNIMSAKSIRRLTTLTTLLAIALFSAVAQARNCQKIGNQVFCDDGVSYQKIGNQTFGSDGSSSQQIGNQRFYNDGSSSQQIGNQRFNSDGSSSQRIGNQIFKSDGTSCQMIGNQVFCN